MLWSLLKGLIFVALVGALTLGAEYLLDFDAQMVIVAFNQEMTLNPLEVVVGLLVLVGIIWLLLKLASFSVALIRFINGDETAISRYFSKNRERKGYQALSEGMMALASGEGAVALSKAAKAERFLEKPELTNLLTAQAAEMTGDTKKAEQVYKELVKNDATRFVGVRGILKQKLSAGDTDSALQLAERAFALKPKHEETQDILLKLQAQGENWSGARQTLAAKLKNGTLPRDVHKRRDAVLALSQSMVHAEEGNVSEARAAAIEANRLSPDLVPATVAAARVFIDQVQKRYATRVLKKTWDAQPHPELAATYAEIEPDETPAARVKRFDKLIKGTADHPESTMLKAELLIAAEDFPAARRALGDLAETRADARSLTIMAAIERGEGSPDAVVKGWLARAVTAPRGSQWVCDSCNTILAEWAPVCPNCGGFDTLSWRSPPEAEVSSGTAAAMLPLIVGALEDKSNEIVEDAEPIEPADIVTQSPDASEGVEDAEVVDSTVVELKPKAPDAA